jgi:hypothetical protein
MFPQVEPTNVRAALLRNLTTGDPLQRYEGSNTLLQERVPKRRFNFRNATWPSQFAAEADYFARRPIQIAAYRMEGVYRGRSAMPTTPGESNK